MNLETRKPRLSPAVPTASMADIAFLLIIFFMLTTSFSPERTSVDLPQSLLRTEISKDAAIVAVSKDGVVHFTTGEEVSEELSSPAELGQIAADLVKAIPNKQFVIKADRDAKYEYVDAVLDQLRRHGARNIGMLTEQKIPQQQ